MPARFYVPEAFVSGSTVSLPASAARHVQVRRLQPGDALVLFNGVDGFEWRATIARIGRSVVEVVVGEPTPVDRELAVAVTLAVGIPSGERMDMLVEKAGELGARAIQPLVCARSVVRLAAERAAARRRHWAAVAASASEQCGRTRIVDVLPVQTFADWIAVVRRDSADARRLVLSLAPPARPPGDALASTWRAPVREDELASMRPAPACEKAAGPSDRAPASEEALARGRPELADLDAPIVVLSGPEGGLTGDEEGAAVASGFIRVGLGTRVLRADTAPLALLGWLALRGSHAARSSHPSHGLHESHESPAAHGCLDAGSPHASAGT